MSNLGVSELPVIQPEVAVPCCPPLTERPLSAEEADERRLGLLMANAQGGEVRAPAAVDAVP